MKPYLILIPIFLFALIQGAFLPANLVLLLVLLYTVLNQGKESLWVAFLSGLILDLAKGIPFGYSSIMFLVFSFLLILYSRRFESTHWLFLPIFVLVSGGIYLWLIKGYFDWQEILILIFLALLARFLLRFFPFQVGKDLKLNI